jgi:hypothetical protein
VKQLKQHQDDQDRQKERGNIEAWLAVIDYSDQQRDFIATRQEGTGEWLLASPEFQEWLNTSKSTLYCPGIPGSGKTIMSAVVVNHLLTKYRDDLDTGISYVYCNYGRQQEQTLRNLLLVLLKQLLQRQLSLPMTILQLYKSHLVDRSPPAIEELKNLLQMIIPLYSNVFIVIDALDECTKEVCDRFLSVLFNLQNQDKSHLNLLVTSRFVPEIMSQFARFPQKEIRAEEGDVLRYIDARMPQLLRTRIFKYPDLQESIREAVLKATSGMYVTSHYYQMWNDLLNLKLGSYLLGCIWIPFQAS